LTTTKTLGYLALPLKQVDYWANKDLYWWQFIFLDLKGTSFTTWFDTVAKCLEINSDISKIKFPTLILQGEKDLLLKVNKLRSDSNKNTYFKEIGTHHHVLTDEYSYSLRLIKEFIKKI